MVQKHDGLSHQEWPLTHLEDEATRDDTNNISGDIDQNQVNTSEETPIAQNQCLIDNRYEIDRKLYRFGGQARIYRGIDHKECCQVVIKCFPKQSMNHIELESARFESTVMMLHSIRAHPNTMFVKDSFESSSYLINVMDFRVEDLRNLFNQLKGPVNENFARDLFR